jgi:hypothetical protein
MKSRDLERLGKRLLTYLPGFAVKGKLLYLPPVDKVLRGVFFAGSIDPMSFYAEVVLLPLCVPTQHIHFTFGFRLRGCSWQCSTGIEKELGEALQQDIIPLLAPIQTYRNIADDLRSRVGDSRNPHVHEAVAYCSLMADDYDGARKAMRLALETADQRNIPWQDELAHRVETVRELLDRSPEAAKERLRWWELETRRNLSLEGL